MRPCSKSAIMKGYTPCKIHTLVQKFKFQEACQNPFYKSLRAFLCKKPLEKTRNIREMTPFSKSPIMQRLQPMQNSHFGSKIKIPKNMSKSSLQIIQSCSVRKTAQKKTTYSRNETILKIGHHANAIAHDKSSLWFKTSNSKNHVKVHSPNHLEFFCAENPSKKHGIFEK